MNSSKREERITAYVDPETGDFIKRAAQNRGRSVSSYVAQVLRKEKEISRRIYGSDSRPEHRAAA